MTFYFSVSENYKAGLIEVRKYTINKDCKLCLKGKWRYTIVD